MVVVASLPKLNRNTVLIGLLGLGLLAGGVYFYQSSRNFVKTDNAFLEADIVPVAARINGDVAEILVADNQWVRRGQVLARLDNADWKAQRAGLQAQLMALQADIGATQSRIREKHDLIRAADAQIGATSAELRKSQADLNRYKDLRQGGWVAQARLESVQAQNAQAVASHKQAIANLGAQKQSLTEFGNQITEIRAQMERVRADMARIDLGLKHTEILASIDGIVGARSLRLGQTVRAGQALMMLVPANRVYVVANFKETQLGRILPGQKVELKLDAFPKAKLTGRVESFSPAAGSRFSLLPPENATGNFTKVVQRIPVRIALDASPELVGRLAPGLSVKASVDLRTTPKGVQAALWAPLSDFSSPDLATNDRPIASHNGQGRAE